VFTEKEIRKETPTRYLRYFRALPNSDAVRTQVLTKKAAA
jgi:hypothetical protein